MKTTYAVKWREPDGQTYLGRLALSTTAIHLDGRAGDGPPVERQLGYEEVLGLRLGNGGPDRLDGRPTLVVERTDGTYRITSAAMQAGVVQELVERLAEVHLVAPRRAAIVLPLKESAAERVRELVAQGPPFDPEALETTLEKENLK